MQHVEKVKIVEHLHPGSHVLKIGFEIDCKSINLLVGDQGCGKSTLLKMMQSNNKGLKLTLGENTIKNGISTFYFNSETDNPRVKNPELFTKPTGEDIGIGYAGAIASHFESHGEVLKNFTITPLFKAKDCVIFLDEPESGLSINNQMYLIEAIETAVKNNCQLFIATHCYPLIQKFDVISLQHNKQMKGSDFIELVKDNRPKSRKKIEQFPERFPQQLRGKVKMRSSEKLNGHTHYWTDSGEELFYDKVNSISVNSYIQELAIKGITTKHLYKQIYNLKS